MRLLQKINNFLFSKINGFVKWYYYNFLVGDDPDQPGIETLKWLPRNLAPGKSHLFGPADSIEFAIDRMPVQEEIIIEVETQAQAQEVVNRLKEAELQCAHQI